MIERAIRRDATSIPVNDENAVRRPLAYMSRLERDAGVILHATALAGRDQRGTGILDTHTAGLGFVALDASLENRNGLALGIAEGERTPTVARVTTTMAGICVPRILYGARRAMKRGFTGSTRQPCETTAFVPLVFKTTSVWNGCLSKGLWAACQASAS
jgi:hypothetical protein